MRIVEYTPNEFAALERAVAKMGRGRGLGIRGLVDHYYSCNPWGKLWLAIDENKGEIVGTLGLDSIPFLIREQVVTMGFGSNFHTLVEGVGGLLFLRWIRSCRHHLTYNSSEQTRKITAAQNWKPLFGVVSLSYNSPLAFETGSTSPLKLAKHLAKRFLRKPPLSQIHPIAGRWSDSSITVEQFETWTPERLDFSSPFDFRVAPDLDYFRWRFDPEWPEFRYHLFSLQRDGVICGLVILHYCRDQVLVVHADGTDSRTIGEGILLALSKIEGPPVYYLATSVPEVASLCESVGFRRNREESRLFFSPRFPIEQVRAPLINFGLGDNDLRVEYLAS